MDKPSQINFQKILKIASVSFGKEKDISHTFTGPTHVFKEDLHNHYVVVRKLDSGLVEITFFKSDRKDEQLMEDYVDLGISFYPATIGDV